MSLQERCGVYQLEHSDSPETACIDELDSSVDDDAEQLWIEETRRRYEAFINGELEARPGEEVMYRVRQRLK